MDVGRGEPASKGRGAHRCLRETSWTAEGPAGMAWYCGAHILTSPASPAPPPRPRLPRPACTTARFAGRCSPRNYPWRPARRFRPVEHLGSPKAAAPSTRKLRQLVAARNGRVVCMEDCMAAQSGCGGASQRRRGGCGVVGVANMEKTSEEAVWWGGGPAFRPLRARRKPREECPTLSRAASALSALADGPRGLARWLAGALRRAMFESPRCELARLGTDSFTDDVTPLAFWYSRSLCARAC